MEIVAAWIGAVTAVASALFVAYRYARRWVPFIASVYHVYHEFGAAGFRALVDVTRSSQRAVKQIHLRMQIGERFHSIGIYTCEPDGQCTWANDWLCASFEIDSKDMLGWGWIGAIAKDDQQRVHKAWSYAVENGLPYSETYTVETNHNSWIAETEAWPVLINGKLVEYVGYVAVSEVLEGKMVKNGVFGNDVG